LWHNLAKARLSAIKNHREYLLTLARLSKPASRVKPLRSHILFRPQACLASGESTPLFSKNSRTAIHSRCGFLTSDGRQVHLACPSSFHWQKTARLPPRPLSPAESIPFQETSERERGSLLAPAPVHQSSGQKCPSALSSSHCTRHHP